MKRCRFLAPSLLISAVAVWTVACCFEAVADLPTSLPSPGVAVALPQVESESLAASFVRMVGAFLLCLGVFAGGMHLYRRYGGTGLRATSRRLKIIERIAITTKSAVTLIALDGKEFLVTSGPESMTIIAAPMSGNEASRSEAGGDRGFDESLAIACQETEEGDVVRQ